MAFNGSGTFLINTAGQPVVSGTVISSTAFNALTADLATGLSTAITKDGQTTVTANIPMSTYKFTGLGVGSAATDSANLSQVQSTVTKLLTSVSGTDTITAVGAPVVAAYAAGQMFYFVATGDNTGAVTLNIDALGAKAVTRDGSVALAAGDIKSGEVVVVVYDGTRFQVVSQLNSAGNATFANVSITSALNVGGVATFAAGTAAAPSITTTGDTNTGIFFPAADTIAFTEGGVEAARFDSSGNLGIGTSSPSYPLQVRRAGGAGSVGITVDGVAGVADRTTQYFAVGDSTSDTTGHAFYTRAATATDVLRLAITTDGNVGIGTTTLNYRVVADCAGAGNNDNGFAVRNTNGSAYGGSYNFEHLVTGGGSIVRASFISSEGGSGNSFMRFGTTVSGTLAERMRLDASGNLGIGTTSPGSKLDVNGEVRIYPSSSPAQLRFGVSATEKGKLSVDTSSNMAFETAGSERMRLDSSGNLGIGTSSPTEKLDVVGNCKISSGSSFYWGDATSQITATNGGPMLFLTGTAIERARITADGNIVAGASAALATTATNGFLYVPTCAGTPTGTPTAITGMAPIVVDTTNNKLYFYSTGVWRDAGP